MNTIFYIVVGTFTAIPDNCYDSLCSGKKECYAQKSHHGLFYYLPCISAAGIIPFFLLINRMHLMNTPWAILLPGACSVWNIIIMRTQFVNIPDGLKEVAMIDGASDFNHSDPDLDSVKRRSNCGIGSFQRRRVLEYVV